MKAIRTLAAVLALSAGGAHAEQIALVGGTIIAGTGSPPIERGVIVIDDKRIVAVGDRSAKIPAGARTIDVSGKFIIPGLMETGVYLVGDYEPADTLIRYEGRYDELAIEGAQMALKEGVTTLVGIWGPRDDLIKARTLIDEGAVPAARLYFSGNVVGYDGPMSVDFLGDDAGMAIETFEPAISRTFMDRVNKRFTQDVGSELLLLEPGEIRQRIHAYANSGVDFLALGLSAHRPWAHQFSVFAPTTQQLIVEEAHRAGRLVVGFSAFSSQAIDDAVKAGVDIIYNCDFSVGGAHSPQMVALLAKRQIPCAITPNTDSAEKHYRQQLRGTEPLLPFIDGMARNDRALIQAGAMTLMATNGALYSADTFATWQQRGVAMSDGQTLKVLGSSHFWWLQAAQEKGMAPMAALMAATRNVARAFRLDKDLGTLERGRLADLVVLDRNPLEGAENYRSISIVMKEGRIIDRDALPTQKLLTAPAR